MAYNKPYIYKGIDSLEDLIIIKGNSMDISPKTATSRNQWVEGKDFKPSFIGKGFNVSYNGGYISDHLETSNVLQAQYTVEFLVLTEKHTEKSLFDKFINLMSQVLVHIQKNPDEDSGLVDVDYIKSMTHEIEYIDNDDRFEISRSYAVIKFETVTLNFEGVLDATSYS